ncbi:MAG: DUF5309 domain-containing protein [Verrucomicrobiales bacterium]|jgi:hypothetical protein|nr:DUF5309 domain-containing protein [Verrucomicrobiales bacterium]
MAVVSGILTTTNTDNQDLVGEWQSGILVRTGGNQDLGAVLFPILTKLGVEVADSHLFNWFERWPTKANFNAPAAAVVGATTLNFNDGQTPPTDLAPLLSKGTVLRNTRTGEYIIVTADPAGADVTVTRGALGTTAAAVTAGDNWALVTRSSGEDGSIRRASYENPLVLTNYLQRFDQTVRLSDLLKGNRLRSDDKGALFERRLQAAERICKDIELAFFDGKRNAVTTADGTMYLTGGVRDAVQSTAPDNLISGDATDKSIAIGDFNAWLENVMLNGTQNKIIYCGPKFYSAISHLANSAEAGFRIVGPLETLWGMHIQTIKTPHGDIDLCLHPMFKEMPSHHSSAYILDLGLVVQKTMDKLELIGNCENPEKFGTAENYRAILGLKLKNPTAFGVADNISVILPA